MRARHFGVKKDDLVPNLVYQFFDNQKADALLTVTLRASCRYFLGLVAGCVTSSGVLLVACTA
jgi:hypothetical protein